MTRKWIVTLLVLLLLGAIGLGESEYEYYGTMRVERCDAWVSLREAPSTGSDRLAKVPLYAVVTDAAWRPYAGDFIYCCYDGQYGYILSEYLEPFDDSEGQSVLDETVDGLRVWAERSYAEQGERLTVTCEDAAGEALWSYETQTDTVAELDQTAAFLGGAVQDPMVMVYNAQEGLAALDLLSGETRWTLSDADLGAGICWAVDEEGDTYIGGHYGPDPVAIDVWGQVKWRSDSLGCYWLYQMTLKDEGLVCRYEVMDGDPERSGTVRFDLDGRMAQKVYE